MIKMRDKKGVWFDPRTKLLLIIICVFSAMMAPSLKYELGLIFLIFICGVFSGKNNYSFIALIVYGLVYGFTSIVVNMDSSILRTMLIAFLGLFHKVYPCGMLSGIFISTTKVNEFLSAMNYLKIPKKIVIPMAVMLRYIPTIREDWSFIKDAMKMRDVAPSIGGFLKNPSVTINCIYVPLMMAASKASDDLSIASVTRGIENPKSRTCLVQIRIGCSDVIIAICFLAYFILGRCL
ncbi:MAG: energy-coupling factor transporter transmembrane protein EcfT [Clostridium sp.]|uniref:energy-coupling factor transporter transmembrane component T n=1 Tax=Clostridium sp. DSM 8431 TaxID=1761781 RepID=UPI0008EC6448|nr:energy-coupling factor transporter transmembrane component T [Clostridium sp. DSM 8431]MCR4943361.1 energy-coupling factor transporter transmembrane protein EcfT [Clostridium sp.]SFU41425.1 energy-coupling factor transport system permease protein [Clostridium sp. DSM 8431]